MAPAPQPLLIQEHRTDTTGESPIPDLPRQEATQLMQNHNRFSIPSGSSGPNRSLMTISTVTERRSSETFLFKLLSVSTMSRTVRKRMRQSGKKMKATLRAAPSHLLILPAGTELQPRSNHKHFGTTFQGRAPRSCCPRLTKRPHQGGEFQTQLLQHNRNPAPAMLDLL